VNIWHLCQKIDPKFINEALNDESWVTTMHDELNGFLETNLMNMV